MANSDLYAGVSQVASALASPTRLRALNLLFQGAKSIDVLAELLGESHANTAAHLKVLRSVGLVTAQRQGKHVYQQAEPSALQLFMALRDTAERTHAETRLRAEEAANSASAVAPHELERLLQGRKALVYDLRPPLEYAAGHIPGARSLPFESLPQQLAGMRTRQRVMAYCRGKYCPSARQGVELLRAAGMRAERLAFGIAEWRALGLPVATEPAANTVSSSHMALTEPAETQFAG